MMKKPKYRMTNKQARFAVLSGIVLLLLLFIDQITKAWSAGAAADIAGSQAAADKLAQGSGVVLSNWLLGIIRLKYIINEGMAYSLFSDNPTAMVVITVLTVFMIIGIGVIFFTLFKGNPPAQMCLAIIESGAIGNLIDRLYFGYVRDFLDISPIGFGTCNPADWCISLGAVALVFIILFIGPTSLFPLTKKWREEAKRMDEEKKKAKNEKKTKQAKK